MSHHHPEKLALQRTLTVEGCQYNYYSLSALAEQKGDISRLPITLKIVLENLLRSHMRLGSHEAEIDAVIGWLENRRSNEEIALRPARVLMQDFTGVPAIVDLAAMREALAEKGGNPYAVNPQIPVDLVIDHSVIVDRYGNPDAFSENVEYEYQRNKERYAFLRWGQNSFKNFRVVPPGTGICHQVNLEYLAQVVWVEEKEEEKIVYPDIVLGTDSHTTMINGLSVLGWGVGGIEAEAAMLGLPLSMVLPQVVGFKIYGHMQEGTTATDVVLTITQMLRAKGVVGKFVEFFGAGLENLVLTDRATIANMAPEYGATCGFFPIDRETIEYLRYTGRGEQHAKLVEAYAKVQGLWRDQDNVEPLFSDTLELDLGTVEPCIAGPKRPQDKVLLSQAAESCRASLQQEEVKGTEITVQYQNQSFSLKNGHVVIAAITSCTNTSNPSVMIGAGLLARKALSRGLHTKPWVKTSLAPGSQVVMDYLRASGLHKDLEGLGFYLVGYGCTTCIGNSGALPEPIAEAIEKENLTVAAMLSGNRNFEGRIHPQVKLNYLGSPLLVVAYALAGSMNLDLLQEPLGCDAAGKPVYLRDIWPTRAEIQASIQASISPMLFKERYGRVFEGDKAWQSLRDNDESLTYQWQDKSTYVKQPPYFREMQQACADIVNARPLAILGDSVTTDHISPAGSIKLDSPAAKYLIEQGVAIEDFNSYGARRGNHEVMMRGTFANVRLHNEMVPETQGGITRHMPSGEQMTIYDAAMRYGHEGVPLVIVAGKEYGTGSSRDWAAKGPRLLGVKAVIAESFERIHRSNLIGMGILPLEFEKGVNRLSLALKGDETFDILGIGGDLSPGMQIKCIIRRFNSSEDTLRLLCRLDTQDEVNYYSQGGILPYVLQSLNVA